MCIRDRLDYALEYELVDRNYSRTFNLSEETIKEIVTVKNEHIPFTDEEMDLLWKHADDKMLVDVLLIQCYSGWRPQELGLLELKNVDLENWTFRGGIKTDAGTDRVVPIHSKIRHLVERKYKEAQELGSLYLLNYVNSNARSKNTCLLYTSLLSSDKEKRESTLLQVLSLIRTSQIRIFSCHQW